MSSMKEPGRITQDMEQVEKSGRWVFRGKWRTSASPFSVPDILAI